MAALEDVVSYLKGGVQTLGNIAITQRFPGSFSIGDTVALNTLSTTTIQVLPSDPARIGIVFHNPNTSTSVVLAPKTDINGAAITNTTTLTGGNYVLLPQDYLYLSGGVCQLAWFGIVQSGTALALTVGVS